MTAFNVGRFPAGGVPRRAAVACAILIGVALSAITGCMSTPVPRATTAPRPADPVPPPAGWSLHVYGRAAFSVPDDWVVENNAPCLGSSRSGALVFGPVPSGPVCFGDAWTPTSMITVLPLGQGAPSPSVATTTPNCPTITSNGLRVEVGPCATSNPAGATVWTIPALGLQFVATDAGRYVGTGTDTVDGRVLHSIRRATPAEIASRSPLNLHISLAHTRVAAGTPIAGVATFVNTTTYDFLVGTCAADGWLSVGLTGRDVTFDPAHVAIACGPTVKLAPGATRIPVSVSTSYQGCVEGPGSTGTYPSCTSTGQPPLPAGTYRTTVVTTGLPADTSAPNEITVTLVH